MEKFFTDLLFEEPGIYTLWGSKPMTHIPVWYFTDEQMTAYYEGLSGEEKENAIISDQPYDLPENWEKWEKIKSAYPMHKFLLFIKHTPKVPNEPNYASIYFINILETTLLMEKHYNLFKKKIGHDFDPLEMVFEAENDHSEFWEIVNNDATLFGLLCGFGEKNSLCFDWKHTEQNGRIRNFTQALKFHFSAKKMHSVYNLSNFIIPIFASYSENGQDPVIKKYQAEKERIKKIYKGQDFLDRTLQQLTSQ